MIKPNPETIHRQSLPLDDDPAIVLLLEQLLLSDTTPESVCESSPELLSEVRRQWGRMRRLRGDLDVLFPQYERLPTSFLSNELPQIPGYEVQSILGRGGMGIVFLARHVRLKRLVAVKMLLSGPCATPDERIRFQREAEAVAGLVHPNVVQVHDVGEIDGRSFFTMEYVSGANLARSLAGAPRTAAQAAQLTATLADAVQAAHARGVVHRDLKPSNVLLTDDGVPKVSDFGLARLQTDAANVTQTGAAMGTPSYMAPEQARGRPDAVGTAVDVYALGAILYELLTGRPPFRAATAAETVQQVISQEPAPPSRLNDQVPRDLETICLKCLNKAPALRYASAHDLAADLRRYLHREPIVARRAAPTERLVKWTRRNPWLATSLVIGMLLLDLVVAMVFSKVADRATLTRVVEADFRDVVDAQQRQAWGEARNALERAKGRLGDAGPVELRRRADKIEHELALVAELERLLLATFSPNTEPLQAAVKYEAALRRAGLMNGSEKPEVVAARIRESAIAAPVLAALDWWAWNDKQRQPWLHEIARYVDTNPTSKTMRESKLWENPTALQEFARSAPLEKQSVAFLHFLGLELHHQGGDTATYLKRVQQAHRNSFLANANLAIFLSLTGQPAESLRYFQAAIALDPSCAGMQYSLGAALANSSRWDDAAAAFQEAIRLDPQELSYQTNFGLALNNAKRPAEAERHFRSVLDQHPRFAPLLAGLAQSLFDQGEYDKSIEILRKAMAADPSFETAFRQYKEALISLGKSDDGRAFWKEWLMQSPEAHEAWAGYGELCLYARDEREYRWYRTEILRKFENTTEPEVAERTARSCLLLPGSDEELRLATNLIDRAMESERVHRTWRLPFFRFAKALAEYRADHLDSTLKLLKTDTSAVLGPAPWLLLAMTLHRMNQPDAAREAFRTGISKVDWDAKLATTSDNWMNHVLRREAETVLASKP